MSDNIQRKDIKFGIPLGYTNVVRHSNSAGILFIIEFEMSG